MFFQFFLFILVELICGEGEDEQNKEVSKGKVCFECVDHTFTVDAKAVVHPDVSEHGENSGSYKHAHVVNFLDLVTNGNNTYCTNDEEIESSGTNNG